LQEVVASAGDDEAGFAMTDLHWDPHCRLCILVTDPEARKEPIDSAVVAYIGDDVLVLVRPSSREVVVAPSEHVATLGGVRDGRLGEVVSALRRVATALETDAATVTIEPTKELVGADGHLCLRVVSNEPDRGAGLFGDLDGFTCRLREILS
jgi:hypothetical protein